MKVCRDHLAGKCNRKNCKYSHDMIPGTNSSQQVVTPADNLGKNPSRRPASKTKGVFELSELSHVVKDLPVQLSEGDISFGLCVEFCVANNIQYEVSKYPPSGITHHPIDGKVIRDVATRRGLAAAIKLVATDNPAKRRVSIRDLWGNNRTATQLKRAAGKGDFTANQQLYDFQCLVGQYDRKDLLRGNGRNNFLDMDLVGKARGADIVLIQDVQQTSTTRDCILAMCQDVHVVVVIAHLELGPMGFNGYHGFWVREGDTIVNWASVEDEPYTDTSDFSWVVESSCADYRDYRVNWCVQQVYGNSVYIVFSKTFLDIKSSDLRFLGDFGEYEFELTNSYRGLDHLKVIPDEIVGAAGHFLKKFYYAPIAKLGQAFLKGSTFGVGTDKRLDAYVAERFSEEPRFNILKSKRYEVYQQLEIGTVALARRWEVARMYEVGLLGASSATMVNQTAKWRNLSQDDPSLNRQCWRKLCCWPCGCFNYCRSADWGKILCAPILMASGCCMVPIAGCAYVANRLCPRPVPRITAALLPHSDISEAFFESVQKSADMSVLDVPTGVYKFGVFKMPKRIHTQTPAPSALRLGDGGKVFLKKPSKEAKQYPFTLKDMWDEDSKMFTYHYGTIVPWHANEESPGGAVGMINALLTGVKLDNGEILTAEQSAVRGQRLYKSGTRMQILSPRHPIHVEPSERMEWCVNHDKASEYVPCLKKLLDNGTIPTAATCRIIAKTNELLLKDKERIIISPGPEVAAWFGVEMARLHDNILESFGQDKYLTGTTIGHAVGHAYWGSGTTPEQRGWWFDHSETLPEGHFGLICCGDDMACIVNLKGYIFGIECDASNWDHSQIRMDVNGEQSGMLNVQYWYYRKFGASASMMDMLSGSGATLMWEHRGAKSQCVIKAKLGYSRRLSGMIDTTDGNTLNTIDMYFNIIGELINYWAGEDIALYFTNGITRLGESYGVRVKTKVRLDTRRLTFLKGYFVDSVVEACKMSVWYPSPEILMKIGASESNPENKKCYALLQRMVPTVKDLGLRMRPSDIVRSWASFTGLPVLSAFQALYRPPIVTSDQSVVERLADYDKWDRPVLNSVVSEQDWDPMLSDLGITRVEVDEFTRLCEKTEWQPGMYVIHPLIKTLALKYYS